MSTYRLIKVAPDVKIECSVAGDHHHETLLFIPGLGMDLRQFLPQQHFFTKDYRVVLVSLRGHGQSTAPPNPGPGDFTLPKLAQDIKTVCQQLELDRAHIIGNSAGGLVGYALLELVPQMVASLTTFGTALQMDKSGFAGWVILAMTRVLGPKGVAWLARRTASKNAAVATQVAQITRDVPREVLLAFQANLVAYDFCDVLRDHPEIPVLLLKAEYDKEINAVLDPSLVALNEHPHAHIVEIEGAGHFLNMECPDEFNKTLNLFLAEQRVVANERVVAFEKRKLR